MSFGDFHILWRESPQQKGPLGSLEFCEVIDPMLEDLDSNMTLDFIDDITLSHELEWIELMLECYY